ncbi:sorbosone dehydrogenase family protein [Thioclava sp. SK-1]|uniref:PQQ-dependent sugar dehydrogenase n=1 Tax=Thioclava sp. SK-1 TaxID=1889770 RepID=UPI0009F74623|nr:PQQ-dependent sugar dehydrogenase [Thioclava sp. SK-1]
MQTHQGSPRTLAISILCLIAMAGGAHAQENRPILASAPQDWSVEVISSDLDYPWDITRDGETLYITEAAGDILRVEDSRLTRMSLSTTRPIYREGGRGLLGMALSPSFARDRTGYFYHSIEEANGSSNRVIEAQLDGETWHETRVLIDGIPGHRLYNGGRLGIGPDGMLYITTGWTEDRQRPQDPNSLAGKILRISPDGSIPADNPTSGSPVWSLGHRNPQGLAWGPDGALYAVEHGQSAHDEINRIMPDHNYGWPVDQGDEQSAGMTAPWIHSGGRTWAPSGATFAGQELLIAALGAQGLFVVDAATRSLKPVLSTGERYRDVEAIGSDLWVITTNRSPRGEGPSEDRLLRLTRD